MKFNFFFLILLIIGFSCSDSNIHSKEAATNYLTTLIKLEQEVGLEVKSCIKSFTSKDSIIIISSLTKTQKCISRVLPQVKSVAPLTGEETLQEQAISLIESYQSISQTLLPEMANLIIKMDKQNGMTASDQEKYIEQAELLKKKLLATQARAVQVRNDFVTRYKIDN